VKARGRCSRRCECYVNVASARMKRNGAFRSHLVSVHGFGHQPRTLVTVTTSLPRGGAVHHVLELRLLPPGAADCRCKSAMERARPVDDVVGDFRFEADDVTNRMLVSRPP